MVPGKQYTPEDFLLIAWRRKWLIVLPFLLIAAGTFVYSRSLQNLYMSETLIMVVPQQVPRSYVAPTVTSQIDQRLGAMSQIVMSRSRLEQVIDEFNLYPERRRTQLMDDVVARMRADITVGVDRSSRDRTAGTSFRVAYVSADPVSAMRVTERLATMFIDANLKDRELLAEGTDQFIEAELNAARAKLEEQEKAIEEYKRRNPWDQAEQVENNRWAAVNAQQALTNVENALNRDRERMLFVEKTIADLSAVSAATGAVVQSDGKGGVGAPETAAAQLEAARNNLRAMELRLKPEHPDVAAAKRVIAELTRKAEQEALATPMSPEMVVASAAAAPVPGAGRLANLRDEVFTLKRRISEREIDSNRLRGLLAAYEQRIENYPIRLREMTALTRDYGTIKSRYHDLLQKKESAKIALNLERQQISEQMRIVDAARLPQRPFQPDRRRINMMGAAAGLVFGLVLAGLFEYRDTSLRSDADVVAALSLPVLALVPVMRTVGEIRRARRRKVIWSLTGAATLVLSAVAAAFWTLGF